MIRQVTRSFPLYKWNYLSGMEGITEPSQMIRAILEQRGFLEDDQKYHSPHLMHGIKEAVARIASALENKEKILIHGDYDVDGIVASVILFKFLKSVDGDPVIFLPTRRDHGYGLAKDAVDKAIDKGITLIITVDCGISDRENVAFGREHGIDFIITDHHEVPSELPDAVAIVHAGLPNYPYPNLSGAAVSYKLVLALADHLGIKIDENEYIPYVGLSTITDIMPLTGENRLFVRDGIRATQEGHAPHIELLARQSGFALNKIGARELGVHIGSRLNAPGRLNTADLSAKYLLVHEKSRMDRLASEIEKTNSERREIQTQVAQEALEMVDRDTMQVHVLKNEDWNIGLLGIAASRVVDETGCPAILLTQDDNGNWIGSGRSPDGINLYEILTEYCEYLKRFGGHPGACGLTIEDDNLEPFCDCLKGHIKDHFPDGLPQTEIEISAKLDPADITIKFAEDLAVLEPYGQGNPKPLFEFSPLMVERVNLVGGDSHMKLEFKINGGKKPKGIFFNSRGLRPGDVMGRKVKIAATPIVNEFNGSRNMEYHITDIEPID